MLYVYIIYIFLLSIREFKVLSHLMLHFMLLTLTIVLLLGHQQTAAVS